jgi:hypothetical protein
MASQEYADDGKYNYPTRTDEQISRLVRSQESRASTFTMEAKLFLRVSSCQYGTDLQHCYPLEEKASLPRTDDIQSRGRDKAETRARGMTNHHRFISAFSDIRKRT